MRVTFWGTRGSIPVPGAGTVRYGGNTPCLSVESEDGLLILDAGTGIRELGRRLAGSETPVHILLSHTHWDHIHGLPFFAPLYEAGRPIRVYGPRPEGVPLEATLLRQLEPAVFPVPASAVSGRLEVTELTDGPCRIGRFWVESVPLRHPGRTLGYRIRADAGEESVSYLTDNELGDPPEWGSLVGFLRGCPLLVHDGMYDDESAGRRKGWGHSAASRAAELAAAAGVGRLALFHHDPERDDAGVDRLVAAARRKAGAVPVEAAAEGQTIIVQGGTPCAGT